jgi:hypothetical protein
MNLARELQQGIEDVNTPVDNLDAVIANHASGLRAKV